MLLKLMKAAFVSATMLSASGVATLAADATLWAPSHRQGWVEPLVKAFNESHDDKITLTIVPQHQMVTKAGAAISGNVGPDAVVLDVIYTPTFAASGQLEDVTDYIDSLSYKDKFSPGHLQAATYNGRFYGVPFSADASILIYNKDLFRKAGLDPETPPKDFAEIKSFAEKITALGDETYGFYFVGNAAGLMAFSAQPVVWAGGGQLIDEKTNEATVSSSPGVRDMLTFYHDLWDSGLVHPSAESDDGKTLYAPFGQGKVGIAIAGSRILAAIKSQAPAELDVGAGFVVGKDGKTSAFATGDSLVIVKASPHADVIKEFASWAAEPDNQIKFLMEGGILSPRVDLPLDKLTALPETSILAYKSLPAGKTPWVIGYDDIFNTPQGPWLQMLQTAIFDGDIDTALEDGQAGFEAVLKRHSN